MAKDGSAVSVKVTNTGERQGTETIQVYIHGKTSAIRRPKRELHGFAKATLQPGESKVMDVAIDKYAASLWDESEDRWLREAGEYEVLVGRSSRAEDLASAGVFVVEEDSWWLGL